MAVRVDYVPAARKELDSAFEWYLSRSTRAASGFLREVERAMRLIASAPEVWPSYEADTRRYPLRNYPYGIVYRTLDSGLQIIAVAHYRRKPGYWRQRR